MIKPQVKIAFGMIVCNGDDFLAECLENIYPYAHSICVAEGATAAWMKANGWSTPRSTDKTVSILKSFPDPEHKIRLYQQDAPYAEKLEQSNAYMAAVPADTDYLWELDSDEFYMHDELDAFLPKLAEHRYTYGEFPMYHFFKNIDTIGCGSNTGWGWHTLIPRLFQYKPGRRWKSHRPPTILDERGIDLRKIKPVGKDHGICVRHYSYVTDKQVLEKMRYYQNVFNRNYMGTWYKNVWQQWDKDPKGIEAKFSTHPTAAGGKTKPYKGSHPVSILRKFNRLANRS